MADGWTTNQKRKTRYKYTKSDQNFRYKREREVPFFRWLQLFITMKWVNPKNNYTINNFSPVNASYKLLALTLQNWWLLFLTCSKGGFLDALKRVGQRSRDKLLQSTNTQKRDGHEIPCPDRRARKDINCHPYLEANFQRKQSRIIEAHQRTFAWTTQYGATERFPKFVKWKHPKIKSQIALRDAANALHGIICSR